MPEEASIYEADSNIDYMIGLREKVLERGSTNFNVSSSYRNKEYTPEDKVLLYQNLRCQNPHDLSGGCRHRLWLCCKIDLTFG